MFGWFRKTKQQPLNWRTQYHVKQPSDNTDLLHYAKCDLETFTIYDDMECALMTYPSAMRKPAEIFDNVSLAKAHADSLATQERTR